jgi:hypothetical protein
MCLGMLVLILLRTGAQVLASISKRTNHEQESAKGFLDFKLQAESAIADLSPALDPLQQLQVK